MNGSWWREPDHPLFAAGVAWIAAQVPWRLRGGVPEANAVGPVGPGPAPDPAGRERLVRRMDEVLEGAWPLARTGCLTRGFTLCRLLRRAGTPATLQLGFGFPAGEPAGHCWVELDGEALFEREDPRRTFTVMWSLPPRGAPGGQR